MSAESLSKLNLREQPDAFVPDGDFSKDVTVAEMQANILASRILNTDMTAEEAALKMVVFLHRAASTFLKEGNNPNQDNQQEYYRLGYLLDRIEKGLQGIVTKLPDSPTEPNNE
jgi:hypothetical protein